MSFITKIAESDLANASVVNAALHRIIEVDYERNNPDCGYDVTTVRVSFDMYRSKGGLFFNTDKVLIIYRDVGDGSVEFHTANAGSGKELAEAVQSFADMLATDWVIVG